MPNPTVNHRITRQPLGLTDKGRVYAALLKVRDSWDTFTPDQRAEAAELVARLNATLRRENAASLVPAGGNAPRAAVPLVGRFTA